jgi:16S rRNA (uracil1498-N3)-methyltransferase
MNLFIAEEVKNEELILSGEEVNHCINVLRYRTGDEIHITDGKGFFYKGIITSITGKQCFVRVLSIENGVKHPYHLHIAIAPTKNINRFEWFLEKAVEIGVDEVTPLICEHSERKHIQFERAIKIIRSAVKQGLHAHMPVLHPQIKFSDFVSKNDDLKKIAAHYDPSHKQLGKFMTSENPGYLIIIGPEGDFSNQEITVMKALNWQFANLGHYRLRTETAGLAVVQTVSCHHWK